MSKETVKSRIEELEKLAFQYIPERIKSADFTTDKYFTQCRLYLNTTLVLTLIGASYKKDDLDKNGRHVLSFNNPLPTTEELSQITAILDKYIREIESNFVGIIDEEEDPDDMSINLGMEASANDDPIPNIDKITNKTMTDLVFGYNGQPGICSAYLNSSDVVKIAALGVKLRKRRNLHRAFIIGGIVLGAAAAGGTGYYFYTKNTNHSTDEVPAIDVDDTDTTTDVDDTDDIPVVDIEDEESALI